MAPNGVYAIDNKAGEVSPALQPASANLRFAQSVFRYPLSGGFPPPQRPRRYRR